MRHGESEWNAQNRFTGWADVSLTERGEAGARLAAEMIAAEPEFRPDIIYTSQLNRALATAAIIEARLGEEGPPPPVLRRWRLNERHYGALTGLPKRDALGRTIGGAKIDEATLRHYRLAPDGTPPPIEPEHEHYTRRGLEPPVGAAHALANAGRLAVLGAQAAHMRLLRRMLWRAWLWLATRAPIGARHAPLPWLLREDDALPPHEIPLTESLEDVCRRTEPFWRDELRPALLAGKDVLLVGHANALRGLLRAIQELPASDLGRLGLPNSVPLVYEFEPSGRVCSPRAAPDAPRRAIVPPLQGYFLGDVAAEFSCLDRDASGALCQAELEAAGYCRTPDECELLMNSADDNGDGRVDFKEFVMWAGSQGGEAVRARARLHATAPCPVVV